MTPEFQHFLRPAPSRLPHWFHLRKPELHRSKCRCWCCEWNVWGVPAYLSGPHLPFSQGFTTPPPFSWGGLSFTALLHPLRPFSNVSSPMKPFTTVEDHTVISTHWPNHCTTHLDNWWCSERFCLLMVSYELAIVPETCCAPLSVEPCSPRSPIVLTAEKALNKCLSSTEKETFPTVIKSQTF